MDTEVVKSKPLTKDETKTLLELIEASKIITTKTTNATNNKLKTEEWSRIAVRFNASATICRRTPQQLRLKWENLKKNARKRSTKINLNCIQTGGGAGEYIPPDEILDRVTSLLGSTASGFEVPFGGDRDIDSGDGSGEGFVSEEMYGGDNSNARVNENVIISTYDPKPVQNTSAIVDLEPEMCEVFVVQEEIPPQRPKKLLFNTPRTGKFKRQTDPHPSKIAKDLAVAEYFTAKKKCVQEKMEFFALNNEKSKLENEKLKLEIENMKNKV